MMKRREFLRATLVTAGVLATGCGDDETISPVVEPRVLTPGEAYFPQSIASGDPKAGSVILWARAFDEARATEDLDVDLELSKDEAFSALVSMDGATRLVMKATAKFDHCVKVKVSGLDSGTVYHYRFVYTAPDGTYYVSHVGRAKTAPAADADVGVRFAFVSCQDFIGRYYNAYLPLLTEEIDFFVHLGDYVYETTGDPTFQSTSGRKVTFTDEAGAIGLMTGAGDSYFAAKSLDNYRQLWKTYRSDKTLQAMHERAAMIAIWDDHEFSDDSHGAVASYFDGLEDERDEGRRKAANQAWYEYMPVDYLDNEAFIYDPAVAYPDDIRIYRDFVFGKHLHLVMTDLRSYRADHLIPEDAFPGAVVADQAMVMAAVGALPAVAAPYVDIVTHQAGIYRDALVAAAPAEGYDPALITGNIAVAFINRVVTALNLTLPVGEQVALIDTTAPAMFDRGFAWTDLGKNSYNTSIGARYLVVKDALDVVAAIQYTANKASQEVMGAAQESWFLSTMEASTATWKVWGNEYCLTPLQIDLRNIMGLPEAFVRQFYMSCDSWDGFRDKRSELIGKLAALPNVVAITGDVHAFYAATPMVNDDPSKKIVEFVVSSISSGTFKDILASQVASDPVLSSIPLASSLAAAIDVLLLSTDPPANPHLGFAESTKNGAAVFELTAEECIVTYHQLDADDAVEDFAGREAELKVEKARFRTVVGENELYMEIDGAWKRWDSATLTYV